MPQGPCNKTAVKMTETKPYYKFTLLNPMRCFQLILVQAFTVHLPCVVSSTFSAFLGRPSHEGDWASGRASVHWRNCSRLQYRFKERESLA